MQLTPEQVNEFIAKAILESQIGEAVKKSIERVLKELQQSYQNPFDAIIKQHVTELVEKHIKEIYRPQLEEKVKAALTQYLTEDVFNKFVDAGMERIRSRY